MSVSIPEVDAGGFDIPEPDTKLSEGEQLIRRFIGGRVEEQSRPYQDPDVLQHYYWDCEMSQKKVADELGCGVGTVSVWLDKTDLGARDAGEMGKKGAREALRVERASFVRTEDGHEVWTVRDPDKKRTVGVHQLQAVADGADPWEVFAEDTHVHHRSGVPWLNLPGFVEVLTRGEHVRTHVADEWVTEDGLPILQTQD